MVGFSWPPLPTERFIHGRPATAQDLETGDAVFVQDAAGLEALDIDVPQYGYLRSEDGSERPVVVVQAERSDAGDILGLRDFAGTEYVATSEEVRLLGLQVTKE